MRLIQVLETYSIVAPSGWTYKYRVNGNEVDEAAFKTASEVDYLATRTIRRQDKSHNGKEPILKMTEIETRYIPTSLIKILFNRKGGKCSEGGI